MSKTPDQPASRHDGDTPAATLIVFRRGAEGGPPEILITRRSRAMRFVGGAVVFPGGKVDPADFALAERIAPDAPAGETAARIAAIRETLEETGLLLGIEKPITQAQASQARKMAMQERALAPVLDHHGWTLDLSALVPWALWCPPVSGGYDTRFFIADLGTGAVALEADGSETSDLFWASACDVLQRVETGELRAIFPTLRNLERLAQFNTFAEAADHAAAHPVKRIRPRPFFEEGVGWLAIPEDAGYPVSAAPGDPELPDMPKPPADEEKR